MKTVTSIISKRDLRSFGFLMAGATPFLFGLVLPFVWGHSYRLWPWVVALPFLLAAFLFPQKLIHIYRPWKMFGEFLGAINSRIILFFVFYLLVWPLGCLIRLFKGDPLHRSIDHDCDSYFKSFTGDAPIDMLKPY